MGEELTILVGTSNAAEQLRRRLSRGGLPHASTYGRLRRFRRHLLEVAARGQDLVVVCVSLDECTTVRHGMALRRMITDLQGLASPARVRCVGLVPEGGLGPAHAEFGCDLYAANAREAHRLVRQLCRESGRPRSRAGSRARPVPGRRAARGGRLVGASRWRSRFDGA